MGVQKWLLSVLVVLTIQHGASQDSAFRIQPSSGRMIVSIDDMVMFQCSPRPALIPLISSVEWIIENSNGIEYTQLQLHEIGVREQYHIRNNTYCVFISIKENYSRRSNNTRVKCRIHYSSNPDSTNSAQAIISIQGRLNAVQNLTDELLEPGRSVNISWTAPYTLNIANSEPDITYRLTVNKIDPTGAITSLYGSGIPLGICEYLNVDCSANNITTTYYMLNFSDVISSCDSLNVTVTPVNGFYWNISGTSTTTTVYLHKGVTDFTASNVMSTAIEVEPNHLQFNLTLLSVNVETCPHYCHISAPNSGNNLTLYLSENHGLKCYRNNLVFNVTNDTTILSLKMFYNLSIQIGNSAGRGEMTGSFILSTHLIQEVTHSIEDGSTLLLGIRFAIGARLWGAQVSLTPEILNKATCESYIRNNVPKTSDNITELVRDISNGVYDLNVYIIEDGGFPDNTLANQPERFHFTAGASPPTLQSGIISFERDFSKIIIILNTALSSRHQYIGILTDGSLTSTVFQSSFEEIPVNNGTDYCFSVFNRSEGSISLKPLTNVYISSATTTTTTTETGKEDDVRIIAGVSTLAILAFLGFIVGSVVVFLLLIKKEKVKTWWGKAAPRVYFNKIWTYPKPVSSPKEFVTSN